MVITESFSGQKIAGVVLARKGSKGIPYKNLKQIRGKSLIDIALESAMLFFDSQDLYLSTDIEPEKLSSLAKSVNVGRHSEYATDSASSFAAMKWMFTELHSISHQNYDYVALFEPTCPFRNSADLAKALSLVKHRPDSIVTVKEAGHEHPCRCLYEANSLERLDSDAFRVLALDELGIQLRRQDQRQLWYRDGQIYIFNLKNILADEVINKYGEYQVVVPQEKSVINIDDYSELEYAQYLGEIQGRQFVS